MLNAKPRTIDLAIGKWPGILAALGVDEKFLRNRHGPCPFCRKGEDRFRFDDKDGSGSFYCSQCGPGFGMDFLMRLYGWSFKEAAMNVDRTVGRVQESRRMDERTEADKVIAIKRVLRECRQVTRGDPVWAYLNRRTGIDLIPPDIKYHPGLYHSDGGMHPVMISILRGPDGTGVTLHRTYLTKDGNKANVTQVKKFMPGRRLNGGAVRLSRVAEHIGLSEGIETALAASMSFGVPVWASTNAVLMEQFMPPVGVKMVTIMGDNDASYVGQAAAYNLAKRLVRDGLTVNLKFPDMVDTDWCDK